MATATASSRMPSRNDRLSTRDMMCLPNLPLKPTRSYYGACTSWIPLFYNRPAVPPIRSMSLSISALEPGTGDRENRRSMAELLLADDPTRRAADNGHLSPASGPAHDTPGRNAFAPVLIV